MAGVFDVTIHAGALHAAGNLAVLAACWPAIAAGLGAWRAVALLAAAGLAANAAAGNLIDHPVIGASGAAAAALAASLAARPHGRLMGLPMALMAPAWLGAQIIFASLGPAFAGIAWPAHLIGAALGALGACLLRRRPPRRSCCCLRRPSHRLLIRAFSRL